MQKTEFHTASHAKCILAGEHSVLRGYPALVVPVTEKMITLNYRENCPFEVKAEPPNNEILEKIFLDVFLYSLQLLTKQHEQIRGEFILSNNIKIGGGLGFSAALCVLVTRWLLWKKWLDEDNSFAFTKKLEDFFHGKSSGADVAGVLTNHIVHYAISGILNEIEVNWKPHLYLTYSGSPKVTKDRIKKINELNHSNPKLLDQIDSKMQQSVLMMEQALLLNEAKGLSLLAEAINQANDCFKEWGLITPELQKHIDFLHALGASAVKPTGAGGGGYVISLWKQKPLSHNSIEFIPIYL